MTTKSALILSIPLVVLTGFLIARDHRIQPLNEKKDWLACIKQMDPPLAANLVCRSLYPETYKLWADKYWPEGVPEEYK